MALQDSLRSLQDFDVNDLDLDSVGSWPIAIKIIVWVLLLVGVLAGGYYYDIKGLQEQLARSSAS